MSNERIVFEPADLAGCATWQLISPEVFVLCLGAFIAVFVYWSRRPKLNEPPLVPYKYPLIGHTLEYLRDSEGLLKRCHEQYGDMFSLYLFREVYTIASNDLAYEMFRSTNFSFKEGLERMFPLGDIIGSKAYPGNAAVLLKDRFYKHVDDCYSRIYRELQHNIDQLIGDCEEPKLINNFDEISMTIIARAMANLFVGEELCKDDEIVKVFATFATTLIRVRKLSSIAYLIHPRLQTEYIKLVFKYGDNSPQKHKDLLTKKLKPIFEKRYQDMQQFGNEWKRPDDLIQLLLEYSIDMFGKIHYDCIACRMLTLIWASIHTTSANLLNTLNDYAGRSEYWNDLRKEQEVITDGLDFDLTMDRMEKLDSFVKESNRLMGHILMLPHCATCPSFTFSNGYQVPKGRLVLMNNLTYMSNSSLHGDNPETFSGFRHVSKSPFARVGRDSMAFGLGKHACPGRWLASRNIKMAMSILIRKYEISTLDGKRPKYPIKRGISVLGPLPLTFKKRK
ncbi:9662_t:CDS:10 [Paraglomus brasilianum]|uniref:9662_t:CDS:1 n=1 Tax=Paraglomus brasilianum TaxID=144538 RepID=A0A9N8ZLS3_9GLOM|nr:9662_t:CDS:10 [Paraglomus brasilianum]